MSAAEATPVVEEWRAVAGYEGRYEVSNLGLVRSLGRRMWNGAFWRYPTPRLLKFNSNDDGYLFVHLRADKRHRWPTVASLVLTTFVGPRPGHYRTWTAAHENGVRTDNRLANLSWKTQRENLKDQIRHGTKCWGERHRWSRLKESDVREIRRRRAAGETTPSLAAAFGITKSHVSKIANRLIWKYGA